MYVPKSLGVHAPNSFPTCIKARQSLSKWDESLLRRSFARFRLKVNSSTFQVIFFKFYEYLWLYLYVFSILFLWLYEWLVSTFIKQRCVNQSYASNTLNCYFWHVKLFLEKRGLQENLNDRVLICINRLESFVEPGNRARSGSKIGKKCETWLLPPLLRS